MAYLMQWYDPALNVSASDTPTSMSKEEVERLNKLLAVASAAQAIPRRLGADASGEELAADKTRCKRIAHAAHQSVIAWGGKPNGGSASVGREAAQVDWQRWWEEHHVWLLNRMRYISTWAIKGGADEKWAKSALVRLNNELKWLEYALR